MVMTGSILVCLVLLALIALAKPLKILFRLLLSAAAGGVLLFIGHSLGMAVGVNGVTLSASAILGLPGVLGMLFLSFLL